VARTGGWLRGAVVLCAVAGLAGCGAGDGGGGGSASPAGSGSPSPTGQRAGAVQGLPSEAGTVGSVCDHGNRVYWSSAGLAVAANDPTCPQG
jgi:hypothetical protein